MDCMGDFHICSSDWTRVDMCRSASTCHPDFAGTPYHFERLFVDAVVGIGCDHADYRVVAAIYYVARIGAYQPEFGRLS